VIQVGGQCGVSPTAAAVAVNLAVVGPVGPGYCRLYPPGPTVPLVSAINYGAGQTRANNAIVPLDEMGRVALLCTQQTHAVLDVNGYFE
jgi:hypothetical protein